MRIDLCHPEAEPTFDVVPSMVCNHALLNILTEPTRLEKGVNSEKSASHIVGSALNQAGAH